jgi:hypothetical protein
MRLQAGPLVHFTILSKKAIVAGAVEGAVCTMPLDKTTHMGTGSRARNNVPFLWSSSTIIAEYITNDCVCSEAQGLITKQCKRGHKVPGRTYTLLQRKVSCVCPIVCPPGTGWFSICSTTHSTPAPIASEAATSALVSNVRREIWRACFSVSLRRDKKSDVLGDCWSSCSR